MSEVRGGVPSGGALSPTTLGSWGIDGGEGNDGCLETDSCRSFFGTKERNTFDDFPKSPFINHLCTHKYGNAPEPRFLLPVMWPQNDRVHPKHTHAFIVRYKQWNKSEIYSQTTVSSVQAEERNICQVWTDLVDILVEYLRCLLRNYVNKIYTLIIILIEFYVHVTNII